MSEKKDFISTRKGVKYLDLFAGAGGFSNRIMMNRKFFLEYIYFC